MRFWQAAVIVLAGVWALFPALRGEWIWDDYVDLVQNPVIQDPHGLARIWLNAPELNDFYPLRHSLLWLEWQWFGANPTVFHVTSLLLHLASCLLFWRLLRQLEVPRAWLGGLIFAIHPLVVESVAWIVEIKNTLSLPFLLLSVSSFLTFDRKRTLGAYVASNAFFVAAMLSKSSLVMLPPSLLLYLWWRHGRIRPRDVAYLIPYFAVSLALGLLTVHLQHTRAMAAEPLELGGWWARLALGGPAVWFYLWKALWPFGLGPIYPQWSLAATVPWAQLCWLPTMAILGWAWKNRASWGRHVLLGGGWFLLHLSPFLGLATASYMRLTWVMDHLAYVSLLGLIGLAVAGIGAAQNSLSWRSPITAERLALLAALGFAASSRLQAETFRSQDRFWTHAVAVNPQAWLGYYHLGTFAQQRGELPQAQTHYERALALKPNDAASRNNLALVLAAQGLVDEAAAQFRETLRQNPRFVEAYHNFGNLLRETGRPQQAIEQYQRALELKPSYAEVENSRGLAWCDQRNFPAAKAAFESALRLRPDYPEALSNLGNVQLQLGAPEQALAFYQRAIALRPDIPEAYVNLANVYLGLGRTREAAAVLQQAIERKPDFAFAHYQLAGALAALGQPEEARQHYRKARRLNPELPVQPGW